METLEESEGIAVHCRTIWPPRRTENICRGVNYERHEGDRQKDEVDIYDYSFSGSEDRVKIET